MTNESKQIKVKISKARKERGFAFYKVDYRSVKTLGDGGGEKYFATREEAESFCAEVNQSQNVGGFVSEAAAGTFDQVNEKFIEAIDRRVDNAAITWEHGKHVKADALNWCGLDFRGKRLGECKVTELTRTIIRDELLTKFDHLTTKTKSSKLDVLKMMYVQAQDMEACGATNPAMGIKIETARYVDEEEIDEGILDHGRFQGEVLEDIIMAIDDPRRRLILEFAALTGLRFGEQAALPWKNVDLDKGRITVSLAQRLSKNNAVVRSIPKDNSKNGKPNKARRVVPIGPMLIKKLKEYRLQSEFSRDDDLVFPVMASKGVPSELHGSSYKKSDNWRRWILNAATKKLGIGEYKWHELRHFYASTELHLHGFKNVGDIIRVSARLGHHSLDFTYQTYSHWIENAEQDRADTEAHERHVYSRSYNNN